MSCSSESFSEDEWSSDDSANEDLDFLFGNSVREAPDDAKQNDQECLKTTDWGMLDFPGTASKERMDALLRHYGLRRGPYKAEAFAYHLRHHPDRPYAAWIHKSILVGVN